MYQQTIPLLTALTEAERALALSRFNVIRPHIEDNTSVALVARQHGISTETARKWVASYHESGLPGLVRKRRSDRFKRRMSSELLSVIDGLALKRPPLSAAAIHRAIMPIAGKLGENVPSYSSIYGVIRRLEPGLVHLAHAQVRLVG